MKSSGKTSKLFHLSLETLEQLDVLKEKTGLNNSALIEQLVREAYKRNLDDEGGLIEVLDKIRYAVNDTNKQVSVLLELQNSFLSSSLATEPENYKSSSTKPHPWVTMAKSDVDEKIKNLQRLNFAKKKDDEK